MTKIYLVYDRKFGWVSKATTNYAKAVEEVNRLNETERTARYVICPYEDFANERNK